ncbi:MAG: hypothetical protein HY862_12300 [Chloroflexi bacterium]|nr:hypothetical protein [Chloroflexota bacterium]
MSDTPASGRTSLFDNRYRYDHIYPRGRSGETLRAWDTQDHDRLVVVKRPAPQDAPPMRAAQEVSIRNERKALERLAGHPALAELRGVGSFKVGAQTHTYIAMDRADGQIVGDMVRDLAERGERLPTLEMLVIVDQLLDLLTLAHEQQVVYNDVDAKHLFWNRDLYRLKVIDWGNAVLLDEGGGPSNVTRQSDVYQVGELLFYIISGGARFDSEATADGEHIVLFGSDTAQVPASLKNVITRATHPNTRRRFSTIAELRQALREVRKPLEDKRESQLNEVRHEINLRNSKQELENAAAKLQTIIALDPGYPESRHLQAEIELKLHRLALQADIDAARIYLDTANWARAVEVLLELLDSADEQTAATIRFIIASAELLEKRKATQPPAAFSPAIDELMRGDPQQAGYLLLTSGTPDENQQLIAERLAALVPEVILLRPHLTRLRVEFSALPNTQEILDTLDRLENTLDSRPSELGLQGILGIYQAIGTRLEGLRPELEVASKNNSRLIDPLNRAQRAVNTLIEHLREVGHFVYTDPIRAGNTLRAASNIDPANPYFAELNDYFDEVHQMLEALGSFKPRADGSDLADWFKRVLGFLKPYAIDLTDEALHRAIQTLETTTNAWIATQDAIIWGRRAVAQNNLTRIANLMQSLNKNIAAWYEKLGKEVGEATYVERLSLNNKLAQRLIEGYETWDAGKPTQVVELAGQMERLAQNEGEKQAIQRLSKLGEICQQWLQNHGPDDRQLTDQTERQLDGLFFPDENHERETFAKQMKTTDLYLKTMGRGLVEFMRHSSTAAPRLLFLHYVWRGVLCVQNDELQDADFWREAALKTMPKGRSNPVFAEFDRIYTGRQLVLEAQAALDNVHGPGDLLSLRALFNQPMADQWLNEAQQAIRQLEVGLRHWEDGDFRGAKNAFDGSLIQLQAAEDKSRLDLTRIKNWVTPLRDTAIDLQADRLKIEQIANSTKIPDNADFASPDLAVDPAIEPLFEGMVKTTEQLLGVDYSHQVRQWLGTYRGVLETHRSKQLDRGQKLIAFEAHFNGLFINKHPAYPLFQTWQLSAHRLPDDFGVEATETAPPVVTPPFPIEPPMPDDDYDEPRPARSKRSPRASQPMASHQVAFEDEGGVQYEETAEGGGVPWGIIAAIVVVVVGVIGFVILAGGGGDKGDNGNGGGGNNNTQVSNVPPISTATRTADPIIAPETVIPTNTATASPTATETTTATASPTQLAVTDPPTATAITATPSATATTAPAATDTLAPTATTATGSGGGFDSPPVNALAIFDLVSAEDYGWNSDWFRPAAGGVWQLGVSKSAGGNAPIVVSLTPDILGSFFVSDHVAAVEAEMELTVYDAADIPSGVYFGLGIENAGRQRASAEVRLVQDGVVNLGTRQDGAFRGRTQYPLTVVRLVFRVEINDDGTASFFIDNQLVGQSEARYGGDVPSTVVLYTSSGGVFVSVTRLEFDFAPAE